MGRLDRLERRRYRKTSEPEEKKAEMKHIVWSYGVVAVNSRVDTVLPETLRSLHNAGFPQPLLFMDGNIEWYQAEELCHRVSMMHMNSHRVGNLRNWISAIHGVYFANPHADRYAIFEDDIYAVKNLRRFLELSDLKRKYPDGYFSLYVQKSNLDFTEGKPGWHVSNQRGDGALGLVFDDRTMPLLLSSPVFADRMKDARKAYNSAKADGAIQKALEKHRYREYVFNPSLLQHRGTPSTIGNGYGRIPKTFPGEEFDALSLLG